MNRISLIALFSMAALAGCDSSSEPSASTRASLGCTDGTLDSSVAHIDLERDGLMRSYELHVPGSYDGSRPFPLVLNFHGYTSSGTQQRGYTKMDETADAHEFIVA